MCFILVAFKAHAKYPLVVAANRDEYLSRSASTAHWWPEDPGILAGRDLRAGGAWFGVSRDGRIAAVTNLRTGSAPRSDYASRGELVLRALEHDGRLESFHEAIESGRRKYNPFNLLYGDAEALSFFSNDEPGKRTLEAGFHAIGNAPFGAEWPKLVDGLDRFRELLAGPGPDPARIFELLEDRRVYDDTRLPDTGLSRERERALSAIFIDDGDYGTRCSTIYMLDDRGHARLLERHHAGEFVGPKSADFKFDVSTAMP
jgi:uncharacterized protein with NRDE domain